VVKTILKLEAASRNYHGKIEENIMEDACIHVSACVSLCQLLLGGTGGMCNS